MNTEDAVTTSSLPHVINTRPTERAAPLTELLQASGYAVTEMPMLTLQSRDVNERDIAIMRDWVAGAYQALVIVSPTAAASGLAVWQTLSEQERLIEKNLSVDKNLVANKVQATTPKPAPSHLIAVGSATAQVLIQSALPNTDAKPIILQPAVANNEGMLAMPEIEHLQAGDKLLVWRGLGGRRLLVDTLQARGVHIDSIAWYERMMPSTANVQYQQWAQQFSGNNHHNNAIKPIVIISSGTAFEHWIQVVENMQRLTQNLGTDVNINSDTNFNNDVKLNPTSAPTLADFRYVVLGVRLASMVAERHLDYWCVEDLAPSTILNAIQN